MSGSGSTLGGLIQVSSPADGVRTITFNRPQKRNALSSELLTEFLAELSAASKDAAVKVIVLTGSGGFFSAGADLQDIAALDAAAARSCRYLEDLCTGMAAVRKPLLAAVEGPALGGGFEVALMCDMIFASKSRTYFALPEVKRGLIPGAGGTQRLTAALGKFKAMRTILLGKPITAEEGLSHGLVCELFEDGKVLEETVKVAADLAANATEAMQLAKEAICRADSLGRDDEFERTLYYITMGTEEKVKGVNGFLKKT
ncbi:putative enoyl-CoA hydratase [Trichoderma sp. SZMC 28011]|uniref:Enoyl-CoA hydratase/isomerase family protein n=1 Tax=Trichoderma guizhouense TaxID=1491466 RepID=A0A1T3CWD0_9HYPO|nr:enoyl-CoA hydratase/isomerase family protein [Trichoderma guizhouense]